MSDGMGDFSAPRPAHAYERSREDLERENLTLREALRIACDKWRWWVEEEYRGTDSYEPEMKEIQEFERFLSTRGMNRFAVGDRVQWNRDGSNPTSDQLVDNGFGDLKHVELSWRLAAGDQGVVTELMGTIAVIVRFDKYPLDLVVIRINQGPKPVGFLTKA
jgi:hypothetical protein